MIWLCPIYIRSILIDVLILPFWVQFSGLMRPSLVNTNAGHNVRGYNYTSEGYNFSSVYSEIVVL